MNEKSNVKLLICLNKYHLIFYNFVYFFSSTVSNKLVLIISILYTLRVLLIHKHCFLRVLNLTSIHRFFSTYPMKNNGSRFYCSVERIIKHILSLNRPQPEYIRNTPPCVFYFFQYCIFFSERPNWNSRNKKITLIQQLKKGPYLCWQCPKCSNEKDIKSGLSLFRSVYQFAYIVNHSHHLFFWKIQFLSLEN